tara:strand:- start:2782 stop:4251 length:1470 start_codon:yes stop_codon:yes gene_type:complete
MINNKILKILGMLLGFLSFSMLPSILWSLYFNESNEILSLSYSIIITLAFALILYFSSYLFKENKYDISSIDAFTIVTVGWFLTALFGSFPYYFSMNNLSFIDCFFESMSGFTTTGATILGNSSIPIETLGHGLLFWRSFTHFLGGMGIIVFSIALLPLLGIGGVQLFRAEVAGPTADKITPRIKQTAKLLWSIYVTFILIETLLLYAFGMSFFDSICHSFATMATGGFSTHSSSIAHFNSPLIEWTVLIFMFIAATNFTLHYIFLGNFKFKYYKDDEFKFYFILFLVITIVIAINLIMNNLYASNFDSIRHAAFTTISLLSTTGFTTENFEVWPHLSITLCFFLFFIGGSAGSTTGGLKIIRTVLIFKYLYFELKKLLHPNVVYNIKIGKKIINEDVIKNTLGFYLFYIMIFVLFSIFISFYNIDLITSITLSASSLGNIGPGLGTIGPYDNWGHLPNAVKIISSFCMLLGRLEIFTVMVLVSRIFFK